MGRAVLAEGAGARYVDVVINADGIISRRSTQVYTGPYAAPTDGPWARTLSFDGRVVVPGSPRRGARG